MFLSGLWETEVLAFDKFSRAHLPVEGKYTMEFPITNLFKFIRNERNVI